MGRGVRKTVVGGVRPPASIFRCRCSGFSSWTGRPEPRQRRGRGRERPPLLDRWRSSAREGVSATVSGTVADAPAAVGGVAPVLMHPCWKAPRPARGPDDEPRRVGWLVLADRRRHVLVVRVALAGSVPRRRSRGRSRALPDAQSLPGGRRLPVRRASCRGLYRRAGDGCRLSHPVRQTGRRTAAARAGRYRLTTTRPLARYRQDGKRPPARSPRQGRPPSRP